MTMGKRIVLCEDHPVVADGIELLLKSLDCQIVIDRHISAAALLAAAPGWMDVELVLLDLSLQDSDGLSTLSRLRSLRDDIPIVVVSGTDDRRTVLQAIDEGAMGFVPKTSSTQTMTSAFKIVLDGGIYLPPESCPYPFQPESHRNTQRLNLTPRQWEILHRILQGKPIKRISSDLDIAESTVKSHITPILRELGVTTRTEAIAKAVSMGLKFPR